MKPVTVIFSNQKGGVGKTTLTRELGIWLSREGGKKILFVDCDPQGNLTKSLVDKETPGLYEAIEGGAVNFTRINSNLNLLAGDVRLAMLEKSLVGEIDCYVRLKELIRSGRFDGYDLVLLDTPPSLGVLTVNALTASDYLVIPMKPALYTLQGTNDLMGTVAKVRKNLNPNLCLLGVIVNGYESVPVITRQITREIEQSFKSKVFGTRLSKSIKLEEAIAQGKGVTQLKKLDRSRAKQEVAGIGKELLRRLGLETEQPESRPAGKGAAHE